MNNALGLKARFLQSVLHMAEVMVEGPDALAFLTGSASIVLRALLPNKAKQFVPAALMATSSAT